MSAELNRSTPPPAPALEDDIVLGNEVLDRTLLVQAVLQRNPSIESARQAWRAMLARFPQAGAFEDPTVSFSVAPLSIAPGPAPLGYNIDLSQRLLFPGKIDARSAIAAHEAQASKGDYEATRLALAASAAALFDDYFVAVRALEINAKHVALVTDLKQSAIAQIATGRGSAQDALEAEAELAHIEHELLVFSSRRDIVTAEINELLHRDPSKPLPSPPNDLPLPPEITTSTSDLTTDALARRPDLDAARAHIHAEEARHVSGARSYLPDLMLSTSYNSMWDRLEHRWMIGLGLSVPLQLGARQGAIDEADALRAHDESEVLRLSDAVRGQVAIALHRLDESRHLALLYDERLVPLGRAQVDAARGGFIASQNSFSTVLAAEKGLRAVELARHEARAEVDRRQAELDHALGRIAGRKDEP